MSNSKQFLMAFLAIFSLIALLLPAFNYYTDQTRVLHRDLLHEYRYVSEDGKGTLIRANYRFTRMSHVLENKSRFHSFVLGSSRVDSWDTARLGEGWYKLNFPQGLPVEHLKHLRTLLARGVNIRDIILVLDRFSFYLPYPHGHVRYKAYPEDLAEMLGLYSFYLWKRPTGIDMDILLGRLRLQGSRMTVGYGPAGWSAQRLANRKTDAAHEQKMLDYPVNNSTREYTTLQMDRTLQSVREIRDLCLQHGINLTVVMNPLHYKNYLALNQDEMDSYYTALAGLTDFYDFSGLNTVTTQNYLWQELSHYIPAVSDAMISVLAGQPSEFKEFGRLVTAGNVVSHRRLQRNEAIRQLPALQQRDSNIVVDETLLKPGSQASGL